MDCVENGIKGLQTDIGCIPKDPGAFVVKFYGIGLSLIGGVSMLFILYAGYILLFSRGNPEEIKKGKSYLFYAIAGVFVAVFGFVFIRVITVDILHLPGFN